VEVCADLHLRPYYGDEDDTDGLYHSEAKRGTTTFHAYATLYARVKNKRYTLAVRRLTAHRQQCPCQVPWRSRRS